MKLKIALIVLTLLCMFELGQNVDFAAGQVVIDWADGAQALAKTALACYATWLTIFPR